jgi:hypothetical protein
MHDKSNPYLKTISDGRNQYLMGGMIVLHYFSQVLCMTNKIHINTMYCHTLVGGHAVDVVQF